MSETPKLEAITLSRAISLSLTQQRIVHATRKQLGAIADAVQLLCSAFEPGAEDREQQAEATLNALYPHAEDHGESVVDLLMNPHAFRPYPLPPKPSEVAIDPHPLSIPLPAEYITPEHFPLNLRNFIAENTPEGYELHHVKMGPDANAACKAYEDTGRLYGIQTVAMPKPGCSLYLVPITPIA